MLFQFRIIILAVVLSFVGNFVHGYLYRGTVLTSAGYCDLTDLGFGRVPMGEYGYNNEKCERVMCDENEYEAQGCGSVMYDKENCRKVPGTGRYPRCCPKIVCN